jgi:aminomethyltransferase
MMRRYSSGGVVDDLYCYRLAPEEYLLIINAGRIAADVAWLEGRRRETHAGAAVTLRNASDELGAVAVQGPRAAEFIGKVFPGPAHAGVTDVAAAQLRKNQIGAWTFAGRPVWLGRTGYTGEDGFEAVAPADVVAALWDALLAAGHAHCLQPAGLGARDTLRTEACFPLYGHELDMQTTPIEAGLGFFVALDKGDFCGRDVLARQKADGVAKRCMAFRMVDKGAPPRPGYPILAGGQAVGTVVSGTQSPTLGIGIGLGYVPPAHAEPGTRIEIEIRGRRWPAEVVKKPFYRRAA